MADLTIIIVTYNSVNDIALCLESIQVERHYLNIDIIIIDNASTDGTTELIRSQFPEVNIVSNIYNIGFAAANNQGIHMTNGSYIMLLNPDTIVLSGALQAIVSFMNQNTNCGICGPILIDRNWNEAVDIRQPSLLLQFANIFGIDRLLSKQVTRKSLKVVSGACLVMRQTTIDKIGLLDVKMHTYEDADLCFRAIKKGFDVCKVRNAKVIHFVGQSTKSNLGFVLKKQIESRCRYFRKHHSPFVANGIKVLAFIECVIRYLKSRIAFLATHSSEQRLRTKAFEELLLNFPKIFLHGE